MASDHGGVGILVDVEGFRTHFQDDQANAARYLRGRSPSRYCQIQPAAPLNMAWLWLRDSVSCQVFTTIFKSKSQSSASGLQNGKTTNASIKNTRAIAVLALLDGRTMPWARLVATKKL